MLTLGLVRAEAAAGLLRPGSRVRGGLLAPTTEEIRLISVVQEAQDGGRLGREGGRLPEGRRHRMGQGPSHEGSWPWLLHSLAWPWHGLRGRQGMRPSACYESPPCPLLLPLPRAVPGCRTPRGRRGRAGGRPRSPLHPAAGPVLGARPPACISRVYGSTKLSQQALSIPFICVSPLSSLYFP